MINEGFQNILNNYSNQKKQDFSGNYLANFIRKSHPNEIKLKSSLSDEYLITGSAGQSKWTEIPWIAIFDRSITQSAQKGYYIVYLFNSQMNGFYLSLNQGWTQYKRRYGGKLGMYKIRKKTKELQLELRSTLSDFSFDGINLNPSQILGKGYELGHICGKFYPANAIPAENILINDLRNLIGVYRELKGRVGQDIFSQEYGETPEEEEKYQEDTNEVEPITIPDGPLPKPNPTVRGPQKIYKRDPRKAKITLLNSNYTCEINIDHKTFTHMKTKKPFMEPHHLIPMQVQDKFNVSIDVPENIVSLCPNCHRKVHHAINLEKKELLEKMYEMRINDINKRGISIDFDSLLKIYNIDNNLGVGK